MLGGGGIFLLCEFLFFFLGGEGEIRRVIFRLRFVLFFFFLTRVETSLRTPVTLFGQTSVNLVAR